MSPSVHIDFEVALPFIIMHTALSCHVLAWLAFGAHSALQFVLSKSVKVLTHVIVSFATVERFVHDLVIDRTCSDYPIHIVVPRVASEILERSHVHFATQIWADIAMKVLLQMPF